VETVKRHAHDDKNCADDDTLSASSKDWGGYDRESFVDNHVGEEECHQEEVTILANGLYLVRVEALLAG
jgi:hypothetical protein